MRQESNIQLDSTREKGIHSQPRRARHPSSTQTQLTSDSCVCHPLCASVFEVQTLSRVLRQKLFLFHLQLESTSVLANSLQRRR